MIYFVIVLIGCVLISSSQTTEQSQQQQQQQQQQRQQQQQPEHATVRERLRDRSVLTSEHLPTARNSLFPFQIFL
jgi:membrane protein involved in colicin uptake